MCECLNYKYISIMYYRTYTTIFLIHKLPPKNANISVISRSGAIYLFKLVGGAASNLLGFQQHI